MAERRPEHLYVVAGYPTSGKTACLRAASRGEVALFGDPAAVPPQGAIAGTGEKSPTADKLAAGLWLTLADLARPEASRDMPPRRIVHLDLLLLHLGYRPGRGTTFAATLERLFDGPALRAYPAITATTVLAPLGEIQRRWAERYMAGMAADANPMLAAKHRAITDPDSGGPLHGALHDGWAEWLKTLAARGRLAARYEARLEAGAADTAPRASVTRIR